MKRILLGILLLTSLGAVNAQVEIQQDGTGPDISGTIIDIDVDQSTPTPYTPKFYVTNNTGADAQWRIVRVKQNVPAGWTDQVCWPPSCFPASGDIYTTPSTAGNPAPTIVDGTHMTTNAETAEIKPQVYPDGANAVAVYMYYVIDNSDTYVDSIGVRFNFVLGVEENTPDLAITVAPNPANSYFKVKTNDVQDATIRVVDVLGNVVLKETVIGTSKTVNTESFRNGIYFVTVEAEGSQAITRKVIVRH